MKKLRIISVIALFLSGCATVQGGKNNLPQHQIIANSIDDKEFLYEGNAYPERTKKISREDLKHDVAILVAILERGYSGRDHLPPGVYERLISDVQALGEKMPLGTTQSDGYLFCEHLANIFWNVPDNHLKTARSCRGKIKKPITANVGENIHKGRGYYFAIRVVDEKRIGLLSLGTEMPGAKDLSWKGFEETIANISRDTDALIIDLRGNYGGMSGNIRWLASYLYGNPAKMPDEIILLRKSAATCALDYNEPAMDIIDALEGHQPVQNYFVKEKEEALREFKKFYKKEPTESRNVRKGSNAPFDPKKGYDKPIRILIDKKCGSACEGGYARFLSHPQVKTYGTNTRGAYHYGDTKPLVLPRSNVLVSIPTSFREFSDGRYIEKIGYMPDVKVPDGRDALEVALKELIESMNKPQPI